MFYSATNKNNTYFITKITLQTRLTSTGVIRISKNIFKLYIIEIIKLEYEEFIAKFLGLFKQNSVQTQQTSQVL